MTSRRPLSHRTIAITSRYGTKASSRRRPHPARVLCSRRSWSLSPRCLPRSPVVDATTYIYIYIIRDARSDRGSPSLPPPAAETVFPASNYPVPFLPTTHRFCPTNPPTHSRLYFIPYRRNAKRILSSYNIIYARAVAKRYNNIIITYVIAVCTPIYYIYIQRESLKKTCPTEDGPRLNPM